jgi:hypothetical protein
MRCDDYHNGSWLRHKERCLGMISRFSKIGVYWQWIEGDRRDGELWCGQTNEATVATKGSIYLVFQLDRLRTLDQPRQVGAIVSL